MKDLYLVCLIITSSFHTLIAQCPPENQQLFTTQSELDAFKTEYPNCTAYDGFIEINYEGINQMEAISDLSPLSNLTYLKGLFIKNESLGILEDFKGLEQLNKIESCIFLNLCCIENFTGFENLDTIDELKVWNLPALKNLEGPGALYFEGGISMKNNPLLESIQDTRFGERYILVEVINNPSLINYGGLNDLTWATNCEIQGQESIAFLQNLKLASNLTITGNESLTDLADLKSFEGCTSMYLKDLSALNDLSQLNNPYIWSNLYIINCPLNDIDDIELREPTQFSLFCNNNLNLKNFSFLNGRREIRHFDVRNCPAISDLEDLKDLEIIQYNLALDTLISLTSFDDLGKLKRVGRDFSISGNPLIQNFRGLEKLIEVGYDFHVKDNLLLENFQGFNSLINIGYNIFINDNPNLISLDGLEALKNEDPLVGAPYFRIEENQKLNSIQGIKNIAGHNTFRIIGNPQLAECAIPPVCFALTQDNQSFARDNALGCESSDRVFDQCDLLIKPFKVFYDENQNGIKDSNEQGVSLGSFTFDNQYQLYPTNRGLVHMPVNSVLASMNYLPEPVWDVSTGNASGQYDNSRLDTVFVGIVPNQTIDDFESKFNVSHILCDTSYHLNLTIINTGTTIRDINFTITGFGEYISSTTDAVDVQGDTYSFSANNIAPGSTYHFIAKYQAPSVTEFDIGNYFEIMVSAEAINGSNDIIWSDNSSYRNIFRCSYDPNDKQVTPSGTGPENLTLIDGTELQYVIRFQNTGNFPARKVAIRDTLNEMLDIKTFKFIDASHPVTSISLEGSILEVVFENINLADIESNEPESHGYISFIISPIEGLADETIIDNTGYIYFDSNPPIITNTTLNKMVYEITTSNMLLKPEEAMYVYPNPTKGLISVRFDNEISGQLFIYDVTTKTVSHTHLRENMSLDLNLSSLDSGIYYIQLIDNKGQKVVQKVIKF